MNPFSEESWMEFAVCRSVDPDAWHPEKGGDHRSPRRICMSSCTVRLQCLDFAMRMEMGSSTFLRQGIYGGMTPGQRHRYEPEWLAGQQGAA